jgi:hypothetical protein
MYLESCTKNWPKKLIDTKEEKKIPNFGFKNNKICQEKNIYIIV